MNWLSWIVLGGLAGWVASMLSKKNAKMGLISNIVVGIIGSWIGGYIMSLVGASGVTGFNLQSFVVAVIGATILLWIFNIIQKK